MYAIISDVHANLPALEAVLSDLRARGISDILCLGDTVGYGADPAECIDAVEQACRLTISGNHDWAVITEPHQFNPLAEEAVEYTRRVLKPGPLSVGRKRARWQWLENLPRRREENEALYVHGSPRPPDERLEYILPTDVFFGNYDKLQDIFDMSPRLLFVGHTHIPGVITDRFDLLEPAAMGYRIELEPTHKYIINAGSVGQPRDGDWRACYLLVDDNQLTYCRVPYDVEEAMRRMQTIGPISREAAIRLRHGR